jgi:type IV secretory pathway VirB10-like protein
MKNAFTTTMAVCAVVLIGVGILAILNKPEPEPAARPARPAAQQTQPTRPATQSAQPRQPAPPTAQPTEPSVKQEHAQTKQAKQTDQPAKRDFRNGDHATVKMKTFACKTMAYFDRWVALMKANNDEAAKKFTSATLGDCSVMPKGDEVIVEQVGRLFSYNACVRELGDIDCRWLRLSMLEAIQ